MKNPPRPKWQRPLKANKLCSAKDSFDDPGRWPGSFVGKRVEPGELDFFWLSGYDKAVKCLIIFTYMRDYLKNFLIIFFCFVALAAVVGLFWGNGAAKSEQIGIGKLIEEINAGQVKKVVVQGDMLLVTLKDTAARAQEAKKEARDSFGSILENYGVPPEIRNSLEVEVLTPGPTQGTGHRRDKSFDLENQISAVPEAPRGEHGGGPARGGLVEVDGAQRKRPALEGCSRRLVSSPSSAVYEVSELCAGMSAS